MGVLIKKRSAQKRLSIFSAEYSDAQRRAVADADCGSENSLAPFVSDYAILYGYSQQVRAAMDSGIRQVVDSVNAIAFRQDYMTRSVNRFASPTVRLAC